jgi:transposase
VKTNRKPRKPNTELKKFLLGFDGNLEILDLLPIVNTTFNETYDYHGLESYCQNNGIKYKSKRDRYIEYTKFLRGFNSEKTIDELRVLLNEKFNINYTRQQVKSLLHNYNIKYKPAYKTTPIGTEIFKRDNGLIFVKKANSVYVDKQRLLYEQYHNVELTPDDYIIFLNGDKNDFSKENLKKITSREHRNMAGVGLYFKQKELTNTGLQIAQLKIKTKEKDN